MSSQPALSDTAERLALPRRFGQYVLFDRIGAGGMAEIFLARSQTQAGVARLAVVKLVLPQLAEDPRFSALLVQEAKLAAQLSHANIVQTFDLGRQDGRLYIAMEYVEGFDLNELLKRCSKAKVPLPAEYALCVIAEALRALEYAHRKKDHDGKSLGIVHRDVSPSNILVSFEGEIKLCDFGIARALNTEDGASDAIEGKASYMAPEHARGDTIDSRADIFSLSVILWELLAGRRLYRPGPGVDMLALARAAQIPELPDRPLPEFDRLRAIVKKGLARSPADRYPTALAMVRDLDDYLHSSKLIASPLDLGSFVVDHFGQEILALRAQRERRAIDFSEPVIAEDSEQNDQTQEHFAPPPEQWERDTDAESLRAPEAQSLAHRGQAKSPVPPLTPLPPVPIARATDSANPFGATMTAPIPLTSLGPQAIPLAVVRLEASDPSAEHSMPPAYGNDTDGPSGAQAALPVGDVSQNRSIFTGPNHSHQPGTEPIQPSIAARILALLFGALLVFAIGALFMHLRSR
jgi:serine/threonine-protein kinase